jgi:ech hydrogenase subunit D
MINNLEILQIQHVHHHIHELLDKGYRFVTMTCCNNKDGTYDIFYTLDFQLKLANIKTTVTEETLIPSISNVIIAAAFAENEIKELFGLKFEGLVLDYGGKFMLSEDAPSHPFGGGLIIEKKDGKTNG